MTVHIFAVVFEWDAGNQRKNQLKHEVTMNECEQVFFNKPLLLLDDITHSKNEKRSHALGQTNDGRTLSITFTERKACIRVISARPMSKRERTLYEKA